LWAASLVSAAILHSSLPSSWQASSVICITCRHAPQAHARIRRSRRLGTVNLGRLAGRFQIRCAPESGFMEYALRETVVANTPL
jgi:hypothetical protein